jgi:hypothetical protein
MATSAMGCGQGVEDVKGAVGDPRLGKGANMLFGPPGAGKSHLAAAIGLALVENGYRRRAALERKRGRGRPPTRATITGHSHNHPRQKGLASAPTRDNHCSARGRHFLILIAAPFSSRLSRYNRDPADTAGASPASTRPAKAAKK